MSGRRGEAGVALIFALVFLSLFGTLIAVVLGFTNSSVLATQRHREQRAAVYAADGAIDGAIQYVRTDAQRGAYGGSCPGFEAMIGGVTATVTCASAGEADDVDRTVAFVATVGATPRVTARVIYRDATAQTNQPQVDVISWTYHR